MDGRRHPPRRGCRPPYAGSAAGHDDEFGVPGRCRLIRAEPREAAGFLVEARIGLEVGSLHIVLGCPWRDRPARGSALRQHDHGSSRMPRSVRMVSAFSIRAAGGPAAGRAASGSRRRSRRPIGRRSRLRRIRDAPGALEVLVRVRQRRPAVRSTGVMSQSPTSSSKSVPATSECAFPAPPRLTATAT